MSMKTSGKRHRAVKIWVPKTVFLLPNLFINIGENKYAGISIAPERTKFQYGLPTKVVENNDIPLYTMISKILKIDELVPNRMQISIE